MANLAPIQNLLDDIKNAIYGEQVRTAIHDSIARCYTDVDDSKTVASTAADSANSAAREADKAKNAALNAADEARDAKNTANDAADTASNAAATAEEKGILANDAAIAANKSSMAANTAADSANGAAQKANAAYDSASLAVTSATEAASGANNAAASATSAAERANNAANDANAAATDCKTARYDTLTATANANTATTRANNAASALELLTVSSDSVGPDDRASVSMETVGDHKNLHFVLKQGPVGAPYVIKGPAYPNVESLEAAVTSPAIGDQYNIGESAPYNIYRWTGSTWEDQGKIGISFTNLTNDEINTLWNGTTIESASSKYINHTGLFYLLIDKIKAALNAKVTSVSGKGLSTNDFSDEYKDLVDADNGRITALNESKVDKVNGKGLSTNDFTDAYKNQITTNQTTIGTGTLDTTAKTLIPAVNELRSNLLPCMNKVLYFQDQSVKAASNAEVCRITNSLITTKTVVLEATFGSPAEVWDIVWQSYNGNIVFTGSVQAATTMNVTLGLKDN